MAVITWLHLSDLHFQVAEQQAWDEDIVLRKLLDDIRARIADDGFSPDLILISGDIASSGAPAEYELARAFFDELLAATRLGRDRLMVVPGNHDVDRRAVSRGAAAIAASLDSRQALNEILAGAADRALLFKRLDAYRQFEAAYFGNQAPEAAPAGVARLEVAGLSLAVLRLNSAWLAYGGEADRGRVALGERPVRAALGAAEGADLRLALLHHPFDWLYDFDRSDVEPLLCGGCQFVLHGHVHQVGLLQARTPDSEAMVIGAGACYASRDFPNAYNWVQLDLDRGQGTAFLRLYSDRQGGFWTKDVVNYRNAPDGHYGFALPAGLAPPAPAVVSTGRPRVFISYKRDVVPDEPLALRISAALQPYCDVFIDKAMLVGTRWAQRIEQEISACDYLIPLLSAHSAQSEMVELELRLAHRMSRAGGRPAILPVRVAYDQDFDYPLDVYLNDINWAVWNAETDTEPLIAELLAALQGGALSVAGGRLKTLPAAAGEALPRPRPSAAPPRLELPEGTMDPESAFYVERPADALCRAAIATQGVTLAIKAPRQMGKSSLLVRTVEEAARLGKRVAFLDFQLYDDADLQLPEVFFHRLCCWITAELDLPDEVERFWSRPLGAVQRCTHYVQHHVLPGLGAPLVLAMDEVDRLFDCPFRSNFFGMLRNWHNSRRAGSVWRGLDLALATSTEPYLLIDDLRQSPFNVGQVVELEDFTPAQVQDLNARHGCPLDGAQIERLLALVSGHPYLVRRALYLAASGQVPAADLLDRAAAFDGPFGDHLRRHLFRFRDKPDLCRAMRQVIEAHTLPDDLLFFRLRGAGLVRREGAAAVARCGIYETFFRQELCG